MLGYNSTDKHPAVVNLKDITDIKIAFKHKDIYAERAQQRMDRVEARELVPGEYNPVVYTGPVTFRCKGQHMDELYRRFGPPSEPVQKDVRCRTTYTVSSAELTVETLSWLERIPGLGIRIVGPTKAQEAISAYYQEVSQRLLNPNPLK